MTFTKISPILLLLSTFLPGADLTFWNRLHLRQNLNARQEVAQPAFFQITDPDDGKRQYAVGIGLQYDAFSTTFFSLGPFLEYQRNTQTQKQQDLLKAGFTSIWQLRCIDPNGTACPTESDNSGFITTSLNYKHDKIKEDESLQFSVYYTHVWAGTGSTKRRPYPLPNLYHPLWRGANGQEIIGLLYSPSIGLEQERIYRAVADSDEGGITRGVLDLSIVLLPFPQALNDSVEVNLRETLRRDFNEMAGNEDKDHLLFTASLTYYFFKPAQYQRAGITLSYLNGEDPSSGLSEQQYWRLAITIQKD